MLTNGEADFSLEASRGEVIRLYLTNVANARTFNFRIPDARMKLVGRDQGRVEHEEFVDEVLISPSERVVMDVLFDRAGEFAIEHRTPDRTYSLGTVRVSERPVERSYERGFGALGHSEELAAERESLEADLDRPPDKTLALVGEMPGMAQHGEHGHGHHSQGHGEHAGTEAGPGIEWEDTMPMMNEMSTPRNTHWKLIDRDTGGANHDIRWSFRVGDRLKVRIVNEPGSDHPMQHPVHIHGQRFLVLARDGFGNPNLAWKDTTLVSTGQTTDILVEMREAGRMDGPLPHREAPGGRDDVQFRGRRVAAAVVRPRDACVVEAYSNRVDTDQQVTNNNPPAVRQNVCKIPEISEA
ncbi:MAG: multicopper oxidase domain-containing protein [Actinomycetota bacterium]|nr:multicopper oxidase domain-containing protein [Actinomycetota bacterium]